MRSLQSQIGLCARAQWILASGMLVFLVSFYLLGYRPHSQHLGGLQAQMQAKQRELDTDRIARQHAADPWSSRSKSCA